MSQSKLARKKNRFSIGQISYIIIFVVLFLVYYFVSGQLKWTGVTNILRHSAVVGVISLGMGLIVITGEIDLSVGAILGCVSSFGCLLFNLMLLNGFSNTTTILLTILFCLAASTLLGFLNGAMVGYFKLPAFIVTLATQLLYRSVAQYVCRILPAELKGVSGNSFKMMMGEARDAMYNFGNGHILTLPICGLIFVVIAVLLIYMTTSTKYGKRLYAVGSNSKAAHMAGVNVSRTRVSVFTLAGFLIGIGSVMWLCMQGNVDPATTGANNEMFAVAAVVLGGIAMSGGKGRIVGVIFGTLSYTVIDKIIAALNVDSLINNAIKGLILIIAIVFQVGGPQLKERYESYKARKAAMQPEK